MPGRRVHVHLDNATVLPVVIHVPEEYMDWYTPVRLRTFAAAEDWEG